MRRTHAAALACAAPRSAILVIVSMLALAATLLLFGTTHADLLVQDRLFDPVAGAWIWSKQEPVLRALLYDAPRVAIILIGVGCAIAFLASFRMRHLAACRRELIVVALSLALVPGTVGALKAMTNVACPTQLDRYGGQVPTLMLFDHYKADQLPDRRQHCFPAEHAAGGFALLSLLLFVGQGPRKLIAAVALLALGMAMAGYKMAIGDHFLSHGLVSLAIAVLVIAGLDLVTKAVWRAH